jgi:hypothetical protein
MTVATRGNVLIQTSNRIFGEDWEVNYLKVSNLRRLKIDQATVRSAVFHHQIHHVMTYLYQTLLSHTPPDNRGISSCLSLDILQILADICDP